MNHQAVNREDPHIMFLEDILAYLPYAFFLYLFAKKAPPEADVLVCAC